MSSAAPLRLCLFTRRLPNLRKVRDEDLTRYLRELNVGPRRRDNVRNAIVQLSRYARRRDILDEARRSVAERIPIIKAGHEVTTWTASEARLLLKEVCQCW